MTRTTTKIYDRQIPAVSWPAILVLAAGLLIVSVCAWEVQMRRLGLTTADLDDGTAHWAAERRKIATGDADTIAIIGASRILFDTDLDRWEAITGIRPVQLALVGTNAGPFLEDLANDEDFRGLLVVGITPTSFFREGIGLFSNALEYYRTQTPAQRLGHRLHIALSRVFAFLDNEYTLVRLLVRLPLPQRNGADDPYEDVWKISVNSDDRNTWLWERIEPDGFLRDHARHVWNDFEGDPVDESVIMDTVQRARRDVNRIRARGGDVVFVRLPSAGPIRDNENLRAPRDAVWDTLIRGTGTIGIHFEDHPSMQGLDLPEWSHLTRESAIRFTDAYVGIINERVIIPRRKRATAEQ